MTEVIKGYLVGSAVRLNVWLTLPGSQAVPGLASSVFLSRIRRDGDDQDVIMDSMNFADAGAGYWTLVIDSTGFVPGTYRYQVKALDQDQNAAMGEDYFVLQAGMP